MKNVSPMSAQELLERILTILGVDLSQQQQMIKEVNAIIQLTLLDELIGKLGEEEKAKLTQEVAGKSPKEQSAILENFLSRKQSDESAQQVYQEIATQKVIPDYIQTLMQNATPAQRDQVKDIIQSLKEKS